MRHSHLLNARNVQCSCPYPYAGKDHDDYNNSKWEQLEFLTKYVKQIHEALRAQCHNMRDQIQRIKIVHNTILRTMQISEREMLAAEATLRVIGQQLRTVSKEGIVTETHATYFIKPVKFKFIFDLRQGYATVYAVGEIRNT